jgi:hypothetical protein
MASFHGHPGLCPYFKTNPHPSNHKENRMELSALQPLYELAYAIGEILIETWGGRVVLGIAIGCLISRLARA